jgi:hypothetical protein
MALATALAADDEVPDFDELIDRGRQVASQISQLDAELVSIVDRVRERSVEHWGMTTRQFVAWQFGLTPAEAGRVCRLATRLGGLPLLRGELEAGRLSAGTVATLAAVATPDNEAAMIETATVATGAQLQKLVQAYKQNAGDEPDAPEPPPVEDSVTYGVREGRWRMRADLAPELGAQVEAALRAEKEAAIADEGSEADGPLSPNPLVSNAEALVRMAASVLAGKTKRDGVLPERFMVLLHLDEEGGHIQGGGPVDQPTVTELLCESWIVALVKRRGRPITITSPTRLATPAQQRALLARDRTCQFPGCGRTTYLKAHHIVFEAAGGPTQLDNLVLLCQTHHTLIHQPGWQLTRDRNGKLWFRAPGGRVVLPSPKRPPPRGSPPPGGQRHWGTYERLTGWGSSVILDSWLN